MDVRLDDDFELGGENPLELLSYGAVPALSGFESADLRVTQLEGDVDDLRLQLEDTHDALEDREERLERALRECKATAISLAQLERDLEALEIRFAGRRRLRTALVRPVRTLRILGGTLGTRRGTLQLTSWLAHGRFAHVFAALRLSGADVDWNEYRRRNGDVARAGLQPLLHYVEHGRSEGRALPSRRITHAGDRSDAAPHEQPPRVPRRLDERERRRVENGLEQRGVTAYRAGDFVGAVSCFEAVIASDADRAAAWLWLSRAQDKSGDIRGAAESVRQALALRPAWVSARLQHADVLFHQRRRAECRALLESVVDGAWSEPDTLRRLANRFRLLGDHATATRVATRLVELRPGDAEGVYTLAVATWAAGDPEGALQLVEQAAADGGGAARSAVGLFLEFDDLPGAWRVLSGVPDENINPSQLLAVARKLRRSGYLRLALAAYEKLRAQAPAEAALRREHEIAAAETRVTSGTWRPIAPRVRRVDPIPGRILHVVGKSLPQVQSGYTLRTHYLAAAQRRGGLEPHLVTQVGFPLEAGADGVAVEEIVDGIVHHRLLPRNGVPSTLDERLATNLKCLTALVERLRPCVLHAASDYLNGLLALEVGRAFGLPVVYEVRGFWEETWRSKQTGDDVAERDTYVWRLARELECMHGADAVVTIGEAMKAQLVARGVPDEKVTVVRNGVDVDFFATAERDHELLEGFAIDPNDVTLGYVSTLTAYEGVRYLIEATAELVRAGRPVHTLVVGDGDARESLETLASQLGLAGRVHFTGRVAHADVGRYYGSIDVFVVPRTGARVAELVTPLKPFEAMAAGRPIVVSNVPALREIVEENITGLLFEPESAGHLASVLDRLVIDRDLRERLGASARSWVHTNATWEANACRYQHVYRSLGVRLQRQ